MGLLAIPLIPFHETAFKKKRKPSVPDSSFIVPCFFEISMDTSGRLGEDQNSHHQLPKVDGCDFFWEKRERKRLIPRWVGSRFFFLVDSGVIM